jgi:indolepyruvate ferredoxin oxidoreductase, beta subunit
MNDQTYSVLFCGTGGQGVLKAAEVLGVAALRAGYRVKKSEVHGMAQRGGSVESHLIFGPIVQSPLIMPGFADILVCFHAGEGKRLSSFLKKDGINFLPYLEGMPKLPDSRFVNTYLLGVLSTMLPIDEQQWMSAIESVVAKKLPENKKIFALGAARGKEIRG